MNSASILFSATPRNLRMAYIPWTPCTDEILHSCYTQDENCTDMTLRSLRKGATRVWRSAYIPTRRQDSEDIRHKIALET